jgi:hypothetical protein
MAVPKAVVVLLNTITGYINGAGLAYLQKQRAFLKRSQRSFR